MNEIPLSDKDNITEIYKGKGDFMRKQNVLFGMIALLALSLWGCGANQAEESVVEEASTTAVVTTEVDASTNVEAEATTADASTTEESAATTDVIDMFDLPETQEHYENMYQAILNDTYETITGGMDAYEYKDGNSGIGEVVMNDDGSAKDTIGYTFVDSNMDGEVELVIGSINEERDGTYYGEMIYSAYTYNEEPILILEGWSRNRCHLLKDGNYYVEGSGGAMYSIFENKQLEKNGTKFIYNDYCFTYEKDETFEEIGFYRNTTGEWDKAVSEEMSQEEYTNRFDEYSSKIMTLELKPFSLYEYSGDTSQADSQDITMHIEWATDAQLGDNTLPSFEADTSESQVAVAVSPDADVHNFKVLSLSYEDVDDAGMPTFTATELYQQEMLSVGTQFVIRFSIMGTIPSYAISYEDAFGNTYYYGLTESGMDGSALLTEIIVK